LTRTGIHFARKRFVSVSIDAPIALPRSICDLDPQHFR
jgi:ABC-type sulfate transport system permease component